MINLNCNVNSYTTVICFNLNHTERLWFKFDLCLVHVRVLSKTPVLEKHLTRVGESITESNPRCHCYREQAGHVLPIAGEIWSNVTRTLPIVFWNSIKRRAGSLSIRSPMTMRHRVAEQSI